MFEILNLHPGALLAGAPAWLAPYAPWLVGAGLSAVAVGFALRALREARRGRAIAELAEQLGLEPGPTGVEPIPRPPALSILHRGWPCGARHTLVGTEPDERGSTWVHDWSYHVSSGDRAGANYTQTIVQLRREGLCLPRMIVRPRGGLFDRLVAWWQDMTLVDLTAIAPALAGRWSVLAEDPSAARSVVERLGGLLERLGDDWIELGADWIALYRPDNRWPVEAIPGRLALARDVVSALSA